MAGRLSVAGFDGFKGLKHRSMQSKKESGKRMSEIDVAGTILTEEELKKFAGVEEQPMLNMNSRSRSRLNDIKIEI